MNSLCLLMVLLAQSATALSNQGILVTVAREGWKTAYKLLVSQLAPQAKDGTYLRPTSQFQTRKGYQLLTDDDDRYHIYLGNPCPWCHRVSLSLQLRPQSSPKIHVVKLDDNPLKAARGGWAFQDEDPVFGTSKDLVSVYQLLEPTYKGKVTAPLLVDKKQRKIVSNESKDIVRLLLGPPTHSMESFSEWLQQNVNNGVYKAGFATEQGAYNVAIDELNNALTIINTRLGQTKFLHGEQLTESDIFLLPTIVRYDNIYSVLFKCTGHNIQSGSNCCHIQRWLRDMYAIPGVQNTFDLDDAVRSYYVQMFPLNPSRIIPKINPLFPSSS